MWRRCPENGTSVCLIHLPKLTIGMESSFFPIPDIYFLQGNASSHHAALELRDAVLRLRHDGAFVAVPLFRVNTDPIGPHPVGPLLYSGEKYLFINPTPFRLV